MVAIVGGKAVRHNLRLPEGKFLVATRHEKFDWDVRQLAIVEGKAVRILKFLVPSELSGYSKLNIPDMYNTKFVRRRESR